MTRFFVGLTGASGHAYAREFVRALTRAGHDVDLCLTRAGAKVARHEEGLDVDPGEAPSAAALAAWLGDDEAAAVRVFRPEAVEAPPSSGTAMTGGCVLIPCSMGTLARVSVGFSSNLVERAADVALKEGRRLLVVPRETPLSEVHLENLLRLSRLGAAVVPAMPGFYHRPATLEDLVANVVGKVLDRLGVEHAVSRRWTGTDEPPQEPGVEPPGA